MKNVQALILLLLACWGWSSPCRGADVKEPYRFRIVVQFARNKLLTDDFQERVRELSDGLQAALGEIAKVEVTTRHPKLDDIRKRGLVKGLDDWRERSAYKTHFVQIDLDRSAYTIQTRQHDGLTGLSSPVVRRARTRDPAYVGRTAALLIDRDLGLLGTVESEPNAARKVTVSLKAGKLGVDLGKWVKKDEVFGLVRVSGDRPGRWEPWAFLQVEEPPTDGVCVCRYYSRYRLARVAGLRAVLLGTQKGPLRLRLLQEMGRGRLGPLEGNVELQIRRNGFEGEEATRLEFSTNGAKDTDTSIYGDQGTFNRLAFISVLSSGTPKARIPVPLLDDRLIVLPVPTSNEEGSLIAFRFHALQRNVFDSYQVQTNLFNEINELTAKPERRAAALAQVRKTIERCQQDHLQLTTEREEVGRELAKLPARERPPAAALAAIDNRLKLIKAGESDLLKHLTLLEKIEKEESDPKRKEWLIQMERAKVLEKESELGQAIAIYEKAPANAQTPALKKHVEELKRQWTPRGDKHAQARKFIFRVWPTLETAAAIKERIKEADNALEACMGASDLIGPVKLLKTTEKHVQRIAKELEGLRPDVNLDDQKPAQLIRDLTREITALLKKTQEYLEKNRKD